MIYAMPGMETQLHAVMNKPGDYEGFSANYSGAGFSGMRFRSTASTPGRLRRLGRQGAHRRPADPRPRASISTLAKPSENVPPSQLRATSTPTSSAASSTAASRRAGCASTEMMALDAQGGTGLAGTLNTIPAERPAGAASSVRRRSTSARALHRPPNRSSAVRRRTPSSCSPPPPASRAPAATKRSDREDADGHRNPRPAAVETSFLFGRLTWAALPLHEPILVVTFVVVALGGLARRRRAHLLPPLGLSLARVVHPRRPQEDRHHVHGPRPDHAAARLRRRDHDARCSRRWPSTAPKAT